MNVTGLAKKNTKSSALSKRKPIKQDQWVICIDNRNYEASLERLKIYRVVSDREPNGLIRVVDESGEDYLFESKRFKPITLPPGLSKHITVTKLSLKAKRTTTRATR